MSDKELLWMLRNNCGVSQAAVSAAHQAADRIEELEAKLTKAVEALGILADDTNWFDAVEEDGTFSPAWRGEGSPEEIARTALAELLLQEQFLIALAEIDQKDGLI